jgi:hypothetical protein
MRALLAAALFGTGLCRVTPRGAVGLAQLEPAAAQVQLDLAGSSELGLEQSMNAYVISPSTLFDRLKPLLLRLGFSPRRIAPLEVHSSCRGSRTYDRGVQGCFLAHQRVWAEIARSGHAALVLESDATTSSEPTDELRQQLSSAAADAQASREARYISVGHCQGRLCTLAYFINPQGAAIGTALDFCKTTAPLDFQIRDGMCKGGVRCTWENPEKGLQDVHPCEECSGQGLFFQNRSIKGLHDMRTDQIRDGEIRETLFLQRGSVRFK